MNVAALIHADLDTSPIGTASRLATLLHGTPVLTRTLRRLARCPALQGTVVVCPAVQVDAVTRLAEGLEVTVKAFDGPPRPAEDIIRTARKWSLHSWRGGLGNTTFFDEHVHPGLYAAVAEQLGLEAIAAVAAEAPLVDPILLDAMIDHLGAGHEDSRMVFGQAPPGIVGTVLRTDLILEAAQAGTPIGWINSYRPDKPIPDYIRTAACYQVPLAVQHASGRLTSDTRRGFEMLEDLIEHGGEDCSAEQLCTMLTSTQATRPEAVPNEVQIELTIDDHHTATRLRPRGAVVGTREPMSLSVFERMVDQLAVHDDILLTLGGFGEPLLHPEFVDFLRVARDSGIFGVAVRTNGLALDEGIARALIEHRVDIVQVLVDATTVERYRSLHGCGGLDVVRENIGRAVELRRAAGQSTPNIIGSLVKCTETLDDMEPFFDEWLRAQGWSIIEGYSHYAGQLPDRMVMSMAPPLRIPCRQLRHRCTILSDGTVVGCDQDFKGLYSAGTVDTQSLDGVWHGSALVTLRVAQHEGNYAAHPLCPGCDEWHRP